MDISDVTKRLADRSGYEFVNSAFVGLPVFRVTAEALCVDRSDISAIDEFLLRAIQLDIRYAPDLAAFMGLPQEVVNLQVAEMIREGQLQVFESTNGREVLKMTRSGSEVLKAHAINRPRQLMLDFTFDGLLRKEVFYPEEALQPPRDLKMVSIPALRGVPDAGPNLENLNPGAINRSLELAAKTRKRVAVQVLKVLSVRRRTRLYLQAIALLFRSRTSGELHVAFAIDGRLSDEHEQAFQRQRGAEKNKLFANLEPADPLEELKLDSEAGSTSRQSLARIRRLSKAVEGRRKEPAKKATTLTLKGKHDLEEEHRGISAVRRLPVLEHHDLMLDAISTASSRLLIISPWIRREIVNEPFLEILRASLQRRVDVYIGYGIGAKDEWQEIDGECKRRLEQLSAGYDNMAFTRLGNTHAKILLKDSEFYVLSSFNWLSFRGDPNRPFREEWGNVISIPTEVDAFFEELTVRFE